MYVRKRKRGPMDSGHAVTLYSAPKASGGPQKKRRKTGPGYSRTSGYYGRFAQGRELKFLDVTINDGIIASGGTIQNSGTVNVISQGAGENQRIGRKATIKSIHWKYRVILAALNGGAAPQKSDTIRMIFYLDKQCNGVTAQPTDILESATTHSFRNLANIGRFQILFDKTYAMNPLAIEVDAVGNNSSAVTKEGSWNKACNIPIEYNATDGTIGEIRSNNLRILVLSKKKTVCSLGSTLRLRFED